LSLTQRWEEIRSGFERPFWVANVTELFERLSYYAVFAVLTRYLVENLRFSETTSTSLAGMFGGAVWILAIFGGTIADRMGFRRALSLAYLFLSTSYFLVGSLGTSWMAPIRAKFPETPLLAVVLLLPALGVALVKPSVVGTTARASKENVRSIGYSIYYTLVNIGGALGPYTASYVQRHFGVENVFRIAALSVFLMLFAVLFLFKEPRKADEVQAISIGDIGRNFWTVLTNFRFMLFLLIFSGYWIVFWQEFIILPLYVTRYIDAKADTAFMLGTGPVVVISFTVVANLLMQKLAPLRAVILGTLISGVAWILLIVHPTLPMVYATLVGIALGEITQSPRYYDYVSRLAPSGQQGTYMGFAFLPIGIGSILGGPIGGALLHHFGEVKQQPEMIWWSVVGIGVGTAAMLWIYDRFIVQPATEGKAVTTGN
jgi:POT family proton-dependent oligopeptide transporter